MAASDITPAPRSSPSTGCRSAALAVARAACTSRPALRAALVSTMPRLPPSRLPRALAAPSARLVRSEMNPASSSATAAICCSMMAGRSAKRMSTPASSRARRYGGCKAVAKMSLLFPTSLTAKAHRPRFKEAAKACGMLMTLQRRVRVPRTLRWRGGAAHANTVGTGRRRDLPQHGRHAEDGRLRAMPAGATAA
jgi:hypothetical protein